ncbi:transcriptional regulator [Betalipothrixvirus pezzuloense]|uniref:Putative regulatory protein n=1 Tax=Betalipothrixvirus pezzuloense TaxID=346883 RepID=A7WKP1_9VIRU|nr:transcriptional regulator [Acidianus filamentous virus 7]CAJ31641.1 putative regulatory protein [Acidianus filamentous virus 7]
MMVTVEQEVFEFLRKKAQEEGVSVPAVIRKILKEYFNIEDKTRDYKRQDLEGSYIVVNGKKYYRINCKLEKRNEMLVRLELKKRGTTLNRFLKELVVIPA